MSNRIEMLTPNIEKWPALLISVVLSCLGAQYAIQRVGRVDGAEADLTSDPTVRDGDSPRHDDSFHSSESVVVYAVTPEIRESCNLAPFYSKVAWVGNFPIVSSDPVSDVALLEAQWIVKSMLKTRPDILKQLTANGIRLAVIGVSERTCDIPEHRDLKPKEYWNVRARGLGATRSRPAVSCAEENLLQSIGDPYEGESILIHEFAHAIHLMALEELDSTFSSRLEYAYREAIRERLWMGTYSVANAHEYWAEGVQSYFDANRDELLPHGDTARERLKNYDTRLFQLCEEVFPNNDWVYTRPIQSGKTRPHMKDLDRRFLPRFSWSQKELDDYRVHSSPE